MPLPRFFVSDPLETGHPLSLPEQTAHHLARVLRLKAGEEITLFNGRGGEYQCSIDQLSRSAVSVVPHTFNADNRTPKIPVELGLCVLKKDPMNSAITRSVELGVASITPVISDHCTVSRKVIRQRQDHWQQVAIAACEQCGMNIPPVMHQPTAMNTWIEGLPLQGRLIALPGAERLSALGGASSLSLLIGPEGGFSQPETRLAADSGFSPFGLGERVLRAETAPVVALSVIQHLA